MPDARAAEAIARFLDCHRVAVFALFTVFVVLPIAIRAAAKPFWHDEIYTVLLAGLPSVTSHWAAVRDGADLAPPLNAFATRGVKAVAGVGPVVTRIPPMVGFWTMTLVVFVTVRRRANTTYALAAACIPLFTAAYRYAYEARPYGLMMGLASLAWWSWTEAARGRNRCLPLLGLSLAAGLWNHYYALLAYLPIVVGEALRSIRNRRIDLGVVTTVVGSFLPVVPLLPLIRVSSSQAANFWARPTLADIPATYRFLFDSLNVASFRWAIVVIAVLAVVARFRQMPEPPVARQLPSHEIAAGLTCLLLPALGVLFGIVATGVFVSRYALPAVAGASIVIPLTIERVARRAPASELVLLAAMVGTYLGTLPSLRSVEPFENPVVARPLLAGALKLPGPTVASGQLWYLQLWYYAPPELKSKLVYLADPESGLRYRGSDVFDRGYLALGRWTAVTVEPFAPFIERHRTFRVYASGAGWLLDRLRDEQAEISERGSEAAGQLYEVSLSHRQQQ